MHPISQIVSIYCRHTSVIIPRRLDTAEATRRVATLPLLLGDSRGPPSHQDSSGSTAAPPEDTVIFQRMQRVRVRTLCEPTPCLLGLIIQRKAGPMRAAAKCFQMDLRLGANLCASYQAIVGLIQLAVSIFLIVRYLYWGLIPSSILYLLVAAVGLAATNDWKAVLTYAPEVVRSAYVYFICTAGLTIAEVFAACWQITYAAIEYTSCLNVPGLDKSTCSDRFVVLIAVSVWKAIALGILCLITYFVWSYSSRISQGQPVMQGQHPGTIPVVARNHVASPRVCNEPAVDNQGTPVELRPQL